MAYRLPNVFRNLEYLFSNVGIRRDFSRLLVSQFADVMMYHYVLLFLLRVQIKRNLQILSGSTPAYNQLRSILHQWKLQFVKFKLESDDVLKIEFQSGK